MPDDPARPAAPRRARPTRPADRGPHAELAGAGRSALSADAAMRVRDLDRPTPADTARAEARLVIVRRNWTPPPA